MNNNKMMILNGEIQKAVSQIINYELQNPNINGLISVTKVDTTNDLSYSNIYLSIFNSKNDQEDVLNQIKHSARYIRKELSNKIIVRKMPFLQFYLDNSASYTAEINEVLEKINSSKDSNGN